MDITLGNPNQLTGGFNFVRDPATRDVSFDDTEAHAVVTSAVEKLGLYWADSTHGSDLEQIRNLDSATPGQAVSSVLAAEAPLEQATRITGIVVVATPDTSTGRLNVDLSWTTPGSNEIRTGTV